MLDFLGMFYFKSETDLAEKIVAYLEDLQWEVYQEVMVSTGVADIVATQSRLVWIIEVKRSLSLSVMAQATARRREAHLVSVAVPSARWSDGRHYAMRVLRADGIGTILADTNGAKEYFAPALNRSAHGAAVELRNTLCDEQKTFSRAGAANGRYWSPFTRTCGAVLELVKAEPGLSLKELMTRIEHHYASEASARSSMSHWIQAGKVPGVEARREDRYLRIYEKEKERED